MLKQQIYADLISAMKAKDQLKLDTLRMLKAAIMKFEVSGTKKEAQDEEIVKIIKKEIKQRQEASVQFANAGRTDDAEKEKNEGAVLAVYLPEQMNLDEINLVIDTVIKETGCNSRSDFGKIMGLVMQKVAGKADGVEVKSCLENKLV